jgi:hypothetical protein
MRWCFLVSCAVLSLHPLRSGAEEARALEERKSSWLTDYETAKVLASRTDRPLFVVFR